MSCFEQGRLFPDGPADPPPVPTEPPRVLRTAMVRVRGIGQFTMPGYGGLEGQLTELEDPLTGYRFWTRESVKVPGGWFYVSSNHRWGLKGGAALDKSWVQVLELAVAPEIKEAWDRIAALVGGHDGLGRPVIRNARFTAKVALRSLKFDVSKHFTWEQVYE